MCRSTSAVERMDARERLLLGRRGGWPTAHPCAVGQRAVPTAPRKISGPDPRRPPVLGATEEGERQRQLRAETGLMLG